MNTAWSHTIHEHRELKPAYAHALLDAQSVMWAIGSTQPFILLPSVPNVWNVVCFFPGWQTYLTSFEFVVLSPLWTEETVSRRR